MKKKKNTFTVIRDLTTGYRKMGVFILVVMVLAAFTEALGLGMVLPVLSHLMNPEVPQTGAMGALDKVLTFFPAEYRVELQLGILLAAFWLKNILAAALRGLNAHFTFKLREIWSSQLLFRYLRLEYAQALESKQGVLLQNAIAEPLRVAKSFIIFLNLLAKLILGVAIAAVLLVVDWKVTLVLTFVAFTSFLLINKVLYTYSLRFGRKRLAIDQQANFIGMESLGSIKEVKALGLEKRYRNLLTEQLVLSRKIFTKFSILNHMPENLIEVLAVTSVVGIIFFVQYTGIYDVGNMLAKMGFFIIAGQKMFSCVSFVLAQRMKFAATIPGMFLIHDVIFHPQEMEDLSSGESFQSMEQGIKLEHVGFSYRTGAPVLQDFSMEIPVNKMTAVIGPSGAGKSTIADLLLGLYHPQEGRITVDGRSLSDYSLNSWRKKVGYVGQEPVIFNASVRENILAGKPGASEEEMIQAARIARIHDFVLTLPQGYDTVVGDKGAKLSGGQRQRVVIARVMIRDPELFIFDEATSALDKETEAEITAAMEDLAGRRTLVVIAHRLSTIKKADHVYDLSEA
ncbi:ABC transporter related [Desulfatibacillum aliphaticivorans]|uniref:ABC transporter related n=1 Tax=Desulfatibacillum aliphaticivorans TaxID=218208 RepID=B8FAS7_DESAL|nr:ABC transporter ATP-binding protein [Desulfatibacillum aliphaticivorans]ACL03373.1 ABC transporter related [Desulfatibacillum aliphaticivorans]